MIKFNIKQNNVSLSSAVNQLSIVFIAAAVIFGIILFVLLILLIQSNSKYNFLIHEQSSVDDKEKENALKRKTHLTIWCLVIAFCCGGCVFGGIGFSKNTSEKSKGNINSSNVDVQYSITYSCTEDDFITFVSKPTVAYKNNPVSVSFTRLPLTEYPYNAISSITIEGRYSFETYSVIIDDSKQDQYSCLFTMPSEDVVVKITMAQLFHTVVCNSMHFSKPNMAVSKNSSSDYSGTIVWDSTAQPSNSLFFFSIEDYPSNANYNAIKIETVRSNGKITGWKYTITPSKVSIYESIYPAAVVYDSNIGKYSEAIGKISFY